MALSVRGAQDYNLSMGSNTPQTSLSVRDSSNSGTLPMGTNTGTQSGYNPTGTQSPYSPTVNPNYVYGSSTGGGGYVQGSNTYSQPTTYTDSQGRTWNNYGEFQNNQERVKRNVNIKEGGYVADAHSSRRGAVNAYDQDAEGVVNEIRQGQNAINSGRAGNALNLRRSMASIASGIRQGLRSGNTQLANMNAGDSSAARAMAMGFARSGNKQASQVGNEAALKEGEYATQQSELDIAEGQKLGALKDWRENKVKDIGSKLWQRLRELDADATDEGLGDIVDLGAKDRVVAQANAELNEVDRITERELGKINGLTIDEVQQKASEMDAAGAAVGNPFSYDGTNVQFGAGGGAVPGAANAPIATQPIYRDEEGNILPAAVAAPAPKEEEVIV